ncbi:MAG: hemerythrin domain-containing protein [Deltaproteobacteria bacterium]|nr:hemerythrin domain-containing protein [Deltaproteobacteria bacterium]
MIRDNIQRLRLIVKSVANRKLDALDLLQIDHIKIRTLFLQLRASKNQGRKIQLWRRIEKDFLAHSLAEETVFYPACMEFEKLKTLVIEGEEEHRLTKTLMRSIDSLSVESERWLPKIYLAMENIEHHVEREENVMFPLIRRYMDYLELQNLGDRIQRVKKGERAAA